MIQVVKSGECGHSSENHVRLNSSVKTGIGVTFGGKMEKPCIDIAAGYKKTIILVTIKSKFALILRKF